MPTTQHRYTVLDGLRGIAAFAVMVYHFSYIDQQHHIFGGANLAVDLFFCLSGFVITHAYYTRLMAGMSAREFVLRRLIRLYPTYLVGALLGLSSLCLSYAYEITTLSLRDIILSFLLNLAFIPTFFPNSTYIFSHHVLDTVFPSNNPAWSLFFEWVANIAFLVVIAVERKRLLPPALLYGLGMFAMGVAVIITTRHLGGAPGWSISTFVGGFPRVLWGFFMGMILYFVHLRVARLALPAGLLAILVLAFMMIPHQNWYGTYWLIGLALVPLVVFFGANSRLKLGSGQARISDYLGQISYPLYCIHYPILVFVGTVFQHTEHFYVVVGFAILLTLMISHLTLRYIDAPFQLKLKAWLLLHPIWRSIKVRQTVSDNVKCD